MSIYKSLLTRGNLIVDEYVPTFNSFIALFFHIWSPDVKPIFLFKEADCKRTCFVLVENFIFLYVRSTLSPRKSKVNYWYDRMNHCSLINWYGKNICLCIFVICFPLFQWFELPICCFFIICAYRHNHYIVIIVFLFFPTTCINH